MKKFLARVYYGWVIVLVGFLVITIIYGNKFCFGTLFGALLDEFGWSRATVTSVFSMSIFSQALLQPFGGALLDRFGPKKMLLSGAFLMAVSLTAFGQARSLLTIYISYGILFSLAAVGAGMVINTTMVSRWFVNKRGLAVGMVSVGTGFGLFAFNPLMAYLIQQYGWRNAVTLLGVVTGGIVILLVGLLVKNRPEDVGQHVDGMSALEWSQFNSRQNLAAKRDVGDRDWSVHEALTTREFWLLLMAYVCYLFTWYSITNHAVMAMCDMGMDRLRAATLFGYIGLIAASSGVVWAWLADQARDRKTMLIISYSLFSLGCVLLAINPGGVRMLYLTVIIIGMAHGAAMTISAVVADRFGTGSMGKIWGTITMAGLLGGAVGPIFVAQLYSPVYSYALAWKTLAIVALIAMLCMLCVRRHPQRLGFLKGAE